MNLAASFSPRMEQAASQSICSIVFVAPAAGPVFRRPRRCRVTCAAATSGAGADSPPPTPHSSASAAMASRAARWGRESPPSQRFTVAKDTPSRAANCSWVRSSAARMARMVAAAAPLSI